MRKFLVSAIVAACLVFGVVGIASGHAGNPANRCTIAVLTWQNNPTPGNAAAATACIQSHTPGFGTSFNVSNFGFNNGFGFNPNLGFNPGWGGFIPIDGFGGQIAECPGGTIADLGGTVAHPSWSCIPGLGNRFPGPCPGGLNLTEFGPAVAPVWNCLL